MSIQRIDLKTDPFVRRWKQLNFPAPFIKGNVEGPLKQSTVPVVNRISQ